MLCKLSKINLYQSISINCVGKKREISAKNKNENYNICVTDGKRGDGQNKLTKIGLVN